jgi:hypothetical protein
MTNTYTADEFLKRLNSGTLRTPLICEGFAKSVEGSRDEFLFSPGVSCEEWTKIPVKIIEKVEFIEEHSCRDHSHPLVQIHFNEPQGDDPFAAVLSSVLRASNLNQERASGFGPMGQHFLMQQQGDDKPAPFIGEWLARVFADAVWYSALPHGNSDNNVGLNRQCYIAMLKCKRLYPYQHIRERERKIACAEMDDC